jgi:putative heme-binding domain-containing protein
LEDGPVLAEALRQVGRRAGLAAAQLLVDKVASPDAAVRAAAVDALAAHGPAGDGAKVPDAVWRRLLEDKDAGVRRAAATAVGSLRVSSARGTLLRLARESDPALRRASLESLRLLREPRAVPLAVAALPSEATQVAALRCLADLGGPDQAGAVVDLARQHPSAEVLPLVLRMLTDWGRGQGPDRAGLEAAAADLQGASGVLARWWVAGPLPSENAAQLRGRVAAQSTAPARASPGDVPWHAALGTGTESRLHLGPAKRSVPGSLWLAYTDVRVPEQTAVQFLAGSRTSWRVWVNGKPAHRGDGARAFRPDAERFEAVLHKGHNRVLVQLDASGTAEFHVRFRHKGSTAEHERLTEAALTRAGDAERGRKVFLDVAKSQCLKCHRLGNQGERIGPELTGVGARFPRIYLIESILEPSRTIAPEYQTIAVSLKDGRFLSGVVVAETNGTLTLGDTQGQTHVLRKTDIDERRPQPLSTMPEGLEKKLTPEEFVDLIAFLAGQKARRTR